MAKRSLRVASLSRRAPGLSIHPPARQSGSEQLRSILTRTLVDLAEAHIALAAWPGVVITHDPHDYATPREISGSPEVHVGRIRRDPDNAHALLMWVVADNLLKGAAGNAVQIADLLAGRA